MDNDNVNHFEYYKECLEYHEKGKPGKVSVLITKPLVTQHDLYLAYTPGAAAPVLEIAKDIENSYKYTSRANIVAVISNGTAILGLGNLGAAASKPVMEGKVALFKKFADIDAIDLEVDTEDSEKFINVVKYLAPSFGGINLEDIKAPECFIIEEQLKKLMPIPVFHDDQHGTAIIVAAGLINATYLTKRELDNIKIVVNGAGAAAIACLNLLVELGINKSNVILCDSKGVIYKGRTEGMNRWKEDYAQDTMLRTLTDAMKDADVFIGLSVKGAVTPEMVKSMNNEPIIFAMANPEPEITPDEIKLVRSDAIIATGRSDYCNQINNVMGFPYIFRGTLDVRASTINYEMKIAASKAIAALARLPVPSEVYKAYNDRQMHFGPEYIIPVPFDPRLITVIPTAVAKAAIESGVAKVQDFNLKKYKTILEARLNPSASYMNYLFEKIAANPQRIVFAEGEEEEILKAALSMGENKYIHPILVGNLEKIKSALNELGMINKLDEIEIVNAGLIANLDKYIDLLYEKLQRHGYLYRDCARIVKRDRNIFAACMIACGDADGMVTGLNKNYYNNLRDIDKVIAAKKNKRILSYSLLISKEQGLIIADNTICAAPTAQDLVEITLQIAKVAQEMNFVPKVALISNSNFGNFSDESKNNASMEAIKILNKMDLNFECDGEMTIEVALNPLLRKKYPFCKLSGAANILIMPNAETASIATNLVEELSQDIVIGPILHGYEYPVQIIGMETVANDIIKLAAFAANEAIINKNKVL